jgi:hypothetical protein
MLCFYWELGVTGLWIGLIVCLFFLMIFFQYLIRFKFDWNEIDKHHFDGSPTREGVPMLDEATETKYDTFAEPDRHHHDHHHKKLLSDSI